MQPDRVNRSSVEREWEDDQFRFAESADATISPADVADVGVDQVTVSAASETSPPETFFVGSTGGVGYAELQIDQKSNGMVYDPVNQVIYLSVPGNAPTNGNTISVVSLAAGTITSSMFAGSEPDAIAISDNSQFLYTGLDGSSKVQRFKLPSLKADISYPLGRSSFLARTSRWISRLRQARPILRQSVSVILVSVRKLKEES